MSRRKMENCKTWKKEWDSASPDRSLGQASAE